MRKLIEKICKSRMKMLFKKKRTDLVRKRIHFWATILDKISKKECDK